MTTTTAMIFPSFSENNCFADTIELFIQAVVHGLIMAGTTGLSCGQSSASLDQQLNYA
ncbi:MAG: hypothetical protein ACI8VW_003727 [bacterium]|jgi:hypothetical protein